MKESACKLSTCPKLDGLTFSMNCSNHNLDLFDIDDFLHLLSNHDNNRNEFEYIYNHLGGFCDIQTCQPFKRNFKNKNMKKSNDVNRQIVDKIHCFYRHSFDTGYKLSSTDVLSIQHSIKQRSNNNYTRQMLNYKHSKTINVPSLHQRMNIRYNQLNFNHDKKLKKDSDNQQLYSLGIKFEYGFDDEYQTYAFKDDVITVFPKYSSLKEELTNNDIATLSKEQFVSEYKKAQIYFGSKYCKQNYLPRHLPRTQFNGYKQWILSIEHLLSLLVYCNYTELQYLFSKTYRENNGSDHTNFYYLGKLLKIAVKKFGTRIDSLANDVHVFYHGISDKLLFPKYVGNGYYNGICISCPLSTSSSFEVAANFACGNQGMIIEFCHERPLTQYFSVAWLSDYQSESEYLLVQNNEFDEGLAISNIVDCQFGDEFSDILHALKNIQKITNSANEKIRTYFSTKMKQLMMNIILQQAKSKCSVINEYGKQLISKHFCSQTMFYIHYVKTKYDYPFVFDFFFHWQYEWIKFDNIIALCPNIEELCVCGVHLCLVTMERILKDMNALNQNINCKLKYIYIYQPGYSSQNIRYTVNQYQAAFEKLKFNISTSDAEDMVEMVRMEV
eukprot:22478_1